MISRYHRGEFSISTVLDLLGLPDGCSSALGGRMKQTRAPWRLTSGPIDFLLLLYSLRTLCYLSSCSLACFACDSKQAVLSVLDSDAFFGIRYGGGSARWLRYS